MRIALDSNLLIYLARVWKADGDQRKTAAAESILLRLPESIIPVVPFQALGESYRVMLRYGYDREKCRATVLEWANRFETVASSEHAFLSAIDLATDHKLQFWDALIINAAADAGCQMLLSEDLQAGFVWRGLRVVNPFAPELDQRLSRLLAD